MHTVQKYVTELNHGYIGYILTVNKRWYDELPDDLQAVVDESADEASAFNRQESQKVNAESKRLIEESGGTTIVVPTKKERQSFKDMVVPSEYEKYRDVIGPEVVDELLQRDKERE